MSRTVCARCGTSAKSQWRIDLEVRRDESIERDNYPLCRECWDEMNERFAGTTQEES